MKRTEKAINRNWKKVPERSIRGESVAPKKELKTFFPEKIKSKTTRTV